MLTMVVEVVVSEVGVVDVSVTIVDDCVVVSGVVPVMVYGVVDFSQYFEQHSN